MSEVKRTALVTGASRGIGLAIATLALLTSASALAVTSQQPMEVRAYHYGMPLDVTKVLTSEVPDTVLCQVVEARMTYLDSRGNVEAITYRALSKACSNS
ncbi:DUF2790 domain-containing protein [Pseudomonas sp. NyZ201]|uniref:DUF2790 domain-containing protein n=1 Tax=Pseudomonas sp. NyZ201 TaxID=3409857 RepID=UPI003CF4609F